MQSRGMMRGGPGMCRMGSRGGGRRAAHFHPFHGPQRGPFSGGEFMPLFRLLEDFSPFSGPQPRGEVEIDSFFGPPQHPHHHGHHHGPHARHHRGGPRFELFPFGLGNASRHEVFNPRFDVKETETAYELRGELPGVDPKDIEVAFSDAQTLIIKGRTERESSSGNPSAADAAASNTAAINDTPATEAANANDDAVSETGSTFSTSSYQQPTVEDEPEEGAAATTTTEKAPASETQQQQVTEQPQPEQQQPREHYWVSERSTGSFSRTFDFPARVNQDGVTASLKNGILELSVPKDVQSYAKRINIE